MSFYFSSDGSLKYNTKSKESIMNYVKASASDVASAYGAATANSSSGGSFSKQMKEAAMAASGRITSSMKDAARASNADYQRISALQAKIQAIASRKPRTFDDDTNFTINTSVLSKYSAAQEKYSSYKKTPG